MCERTGDLCYKPLRISEYTFLMPKGLVATGGSNRLVLRGRRVEIFRFLVFFFLFINVGKSFKEGSFENHHSRSLET